MARVLIGWELGANRGHLDAMLRIARHLLGEGHEVHLALQQIDGAGLDTDPRLHIWQAPVWPRLLIGLSQTYRLGAATMGDILARVGMDRPGALAAMIRGWDLIFTATKPDLVIADFAPAMLAAARGRIETVQTGSGFTCPDANAAEFPILSGGAAIASEADYLDIADADLRSTGREPLTALPALFASDHLMISGFAELDPYRDARPDCHYAPNISGPFPATPPGAGEEVFVYFYRQASAESPLWDGLALSGRKVRIHMTDATSTHIERFRKLGFTVEPRPLPFDRIAARSRLCLSHGGQGFVSSCLVYGLPQIIAWYDLEKRLNGHAVTAGGFGRDFNYHAADAASVAETVNALWDDAPVHARCTSAQPGFSEQMDHRVEPKIASLLG